MKVAIIGAGNMGGAIAKGLAQGGIIAANDIIVSNPPYIADNQQNIVDKNVLMYEPHSALFVPQTDPLLFYRRMASIKKSRQLFFEINPFFAREMYDMLCTYGYSQINIRNDIEGKQRFIRATWL